MNEDIEQALHDKAEAIVAAMHGLPEIEGGTLRIVSARTNPYIKDRRHVAVVFMPPVEKLNAGHEQSALSFVGKPDDKPVDVYAAEFAAFIAADPAARKAA